MIQPGDLVICRGSLYGIILEIDDGDFEDDNIIWAKIMWNDSRTSWEDMITSTEDGVFELVG